jgi:hypothetical protein
MLEFCESSSVGRAFACQAKGRGFESRLSLHLSSCDIYLHMKTLLQEEISNIRRVMGLQESLGAPIKNINVTDQFASQRKGYKHHGVDLATQSGSDVVAINNGIVIDSGFRNNKCGGTLEIEHPGGFKSRFCHLKKINVRKGENVKKGQVVGLSGGAKGDVGAGSSTGPHLHFELKKDNTLVDPLKYINKNDFTSLNGEVSQTTGDQGSEEQYVSKSTFDPNAPKPKEDIGKLKQIFSDFGLMGESINESMIKIQSGYINSIVSGKVVDLNLSEEQCIDSITIKFTHKNQESYVTYCSIEKPLVSIGENVRKGDRIGYSDDDVTANFFDYKGNPLDTYSSSGKVYSKDPSKVIRDYEPDPEHSPWFKEGPYYGNLSDVIKTFKKKINPFSSRFGIDPATGEKIMVHKGGILPNKGPKLPYRERIKYSVIKPDDPLQKIKNKKSSNKGKLKEELDSIKKLLK